MCLLVVVRCFLSSFLCRIMYIAYCMAMTLISSNVYLMLSLGILKVILILSIKGMCVDALAHAVMTIGGSTFQPLLIILFISGLHFSYHSFIWYSIVTICEFNELYC